MPKKYNVTWTEHYKCSAMVEADSADEAMAACYDLEVGEYRREHEGTSDWTAIPEEGQQ